MTNPEMRGVPSFVGPLTHCFSRIHHGRGAWRWRPRGLEVPTYLCTKGTRIRNRIQCSFYLSSSSHLLVLTFVINFDVRLFRPKHCPGHHTVLSFFPSVATK